MSQMVLPEEYQMPFKLNSKELGQSRLRWEKAVAPSTIIRVRAVRPGKSGMSPAACDPCPEQRRTSPRGIQ